MLTMRRRPGVSLPPVTAKAATSPVLLKLKTRIAAGGPGSGRHPGAPMPSKIAESGWAARNGRWHSVGVSSHIGYALTNGLAQYNPKQGPLGSALANGHIRVMFYRDNIGIQAHPTVSKQRVGDILLRLPADKNATIEYGDGTGWGHDSDEGKVSELRQRIAAGGPGSGRHSEYGDMHKMLVKNGYERHKSIGERQSYIHPDSRVHIQINPRTGGWRRAEYSDHEGGHGAATLHDYLRGRYKVAAGGPGSGCHGPNCGRPASEIAKTLASIPRSEFKLTKDQRKIENTFRRQLAVDPKASIMSYRARFGNVLNADNAKELSPEYAKNRTDYALAVHEPASWLVSQMYKADLSVPAPAGIENMTLFTAGGAGSGKTTALESDQTIRDMLPKVQTVFDGTLRPAEKAISKVGQALGAGKDVMVVFVHRDPIEALDGVIHRAIRTGRTVAVAEMARQYSSIQDSMQALQDKFGSTPNFHLSVVDNSRGAGNAKVATLDTIKPMTETAESLYTAMKGHLDAQFKQGLIPDKIYKAIAGPKLPAKEIGM